jgi:hypothetical protein
MLISYSWQLCGPVTGLVYSSYPEVVISDKFYPIIQHLSPEYSTLRNHHRQNFKSKFLENVPLQQYLERRMTDQKGQHKYCKVVCV